MFRFNKNHIKMDMKKIRKVMSIFLACCLLQILPERYAYSEISGTSILI